VDVKYDGEPKFEKIEDRDVVRGQHGQVGAVGGGGTTGDPAIWFESDRAMGPWAVSTKVPAEVQSIPPESPVYNVKYVYIYDTTPEVVYVGYTPAYYGSYVYGGCVVSGPATITPLRRLLLSAASDIRLRRTLQPLHGLGHVVRHQLRMDDRVVRRYGDTGSRRKHGTAHHGYHHGTTRATAMAIAGYGQWLRRGKN
jgi:hypothetical protein